MGTIRVTGEGSLRLRPDTVRLTLILTGRSMDYAEALKASSESVEELRSSVSAFGFERSDLKTLSFDVNTEYESYREDDVYKQRFAGYSYRHALKLEFPADNDRLGAVLGTLTATSAHPELSIGYTVSDEERAKNDLLRDAVRDARDKAATLAGAAGLRLGEISSIDYSRARIDFEVRPVNRLAADTVLAKAAPLAMDIEPDDVSVSDTVTIVWTTEEA